MDVGMLGYMSVGVLRNTLVGRTMQYMYIGT